MSSPLSGFTAVPNPQMLAFMPIQSYLMMYFAGGGWQIGKRKISAIPNETFNKMSVKDLLEDFTADLRATMPTLERSLQDITPLIKILVEQYGDFIREAIAATPQAIQNAIQQESLAGQVVHAPEGQGALKTLENIVNMLTGGILDPLPEADARLSNASQTGQRTGDFGGSLFQADFAKSQTGETNAQRAQRLQAEHNAEVQRLTLLSALKSPKIATVHQTALQASRTTLLRPAGQTQKLERTRLTKLILAESRQFKQAKATLAKYSLSISKLKSLHGIQMSSASKAKFQANASRTMLLSTQRLKKTQTLLSGLIARYRW